MVEGGGGLKQGHVCVCGGEDVNWAEREEE